MACSVLRGFERAVDVRVFGADYDTKWVIVNSWFCTGLWKSREKLKKLDEKSTCILFRFLVYLGQWMTQNKHHKNKKMKR